MEFSPVTIAILFVAGLLVLFRLALRTKGAKKVRRRGMFHGVGPGASGAIYDLLNEDTRNAIEIIVEDKAAAREEETADDTVHRRVRPYRELPMDDHRKL